MHLIHPFSRRTNGTDSRKSRRVLAVCSFALLVALAWLVGCQSHSPSHYVSPRVIGRVLDAGTGQPLGGVAVKRVVPDYAAGSMDQVRGAELLARPQPLHTSADGAFNLDSEKSVSFFRQIAWFSAEISFARRGYETFITNYTPANAVFLPSGEAVIHAGDIWLKPKIELNH